MQLSFKQPAKFHPPSLIYDLSTSPLGVLIRVIYHVLLVCQPGHLSDDPITIVAVSDSHDYTPDLPFGDVLIHAGDLTRNGTPTDIQAQIDWLDSLPHTHKIAIAGNHDYFLDSRAYAHLPDPKQPSTSRLDWKSVKYLQHNSTTLHLPHTDRTLTVYGAPQIPACGPEYFAFQYPADEIHDAWNDTVPANTDVLITHTPPKHHLDLAPRALGDPFLLKEVWRAKPLVHVFGHVHAARGTQVVSFDRPQTVYERAMDRADKHNSVLRQVFDVPLWIDVGRLVVYGFVGLVWRYVWAGEVRSCRMINAGLVDYKNALTHKALVFDI